MARREWCWVQGSGPRPWRRASMAPVPEGYSLLRSWFSFHWEFREWDWDQTANRTIRLDIQIYPQRHFASPHSKPCFQPPPKTHWQILPGVHIYNTVTVEGHLNNTNGQSSSLIFLTYLKRILMHLSCGSFPKWNSAAWFFIQVPCDV